MLHFVAILVALAGLVGSFLTYIGKLNYGSLTVWCVVAVAGILATIITRRPAN